MDRDLTLGGTILNSKIKFKLMVNKLKNKAESVLSALFLFF